MVRLTGKDLLGKLPSSLLSEAHTIVFKPLTVDNQVACCAVEDSAFTNPEHRATPEKVSQAYQPFSFVLFGHPESTFSMNQGPPSKPSLKLTYHQFSYRLSKCSDISYGIFARLEPEPQPRALASKISADRTLALATEDETGELVLLAHIVSTMGTDPVVMDRDMDFPRNWRDAEASRGSSLGHQEDGRTVCLHSLAVIPEVHGSGFGKLIVSAYLRVMRESGLCDRVALLCQDVSYLESLSGALPRLFPPLLPPPHPPKKGNSLE